MAVRTLSATEARIVLALEEGHRSDATLTDLQELAGVGRGFARKLAHGLVVKGWLERVGRGRYLLNASGRGPEVSPERDPLRVGSRLVTPYYFGYATAAELWGMLLRPGRTYFLVTTSRTTVRWGGPSTFRVVRSSPRRFFGATTVRRRGELLRVSDRERTVLDCLDRPELAGGLAGAVGILGRAAGRLSAPRLAAYLRRLDRRSLAARVGYLLEQLRPPSARGLREVSRWLPRPDGPWVPLGPPSTYGRTGPRDRRWRIVENMPRAELFAEVEAR